jgi:hypothetical protein
MRCKLRIIMEHLDEYYLRAKPQSDESLLKMESRTFRIALSSSSLRMKTLAMATPSRILASVTVLQTPSTNPRFEIVVDPNFRRIPQ